MDNPNPKPKSDRDDGRIWGHIENGVFWAIPKPPMINAGYGPPPFDITLPDGRVRHIVHDPNEEAECH